MAYTILRTDKMSGTKQPADLVSVKFFTVSGSDASEAAAENGIIVELKGYITGERELIHAEAATSSSAMTELALLAGVENFHDGYAHGLDEWINPAGAPTRAYRLRSKNEFSMTAEGFTGTAPVVGDKLNITTGGKLTVNASGTFGKCVAIETVKGKVFYDVEIGNVENIVAAD